MPLSIKRTSAAEYGRNIKLLLCGHSGTGKTLASSTAPNPLFACTEPGLMSVADRNVAYADIQEPLDLLQLHAALDQDPKIRAETIGAEVETVVLDTVDEIQRMFISQRLAETNKETLTMQDFGWLKEQMINLIRSYRNLNLNCIFICHVKEQTDEESGHIYVKPGLQGAVADEIPGYVDIAAVTGYEDRAVVDGGQTKRVIQRFLQTQQDAKHEWLKDRSGKLPARFDLNFEDDFQRMYSMIFGSKVSASVDSPEERAEKIVTPPEEKTEIIEREPEQPANPVKETTT